MKVTLIAIDGEAKRGECWNLLVFDLTLYSGILPKY
jgi:hypothetical protein